MSYKKRNFPLQHGQFETILSTHPLKISQSKMDKFQVRSNNEKTLKISKKFHVLEFNQNFMAYIGISSHHLTESSNEFFRSIVPYFILLNLFSWCIVSGSIFAYRNIENLELALVTALVIVAGFQSGGMFLAVGLKMTTLKTVHLRLQEIVNNCECNFFP